MSKTIDQKVVEMRFDNGQFEKGIAQSTASINDFKKTLNFSDTNAQMAAQLSNISDGIGNLEKRFSALGEFVMGIKTKIINSVAGIAQSLTLGMVKAGYSKYEEMMDSVQIIMSATRQEWEDQGEQMEYVTQQVEKLNWYTDETSWSLTDMTNNIGKFTSAGVKIEDAVKAMEGIGSWAGQSGASVEQMNRAMYNLSQAMALGSVRVQDWMSIENANMATLEFKNTAIQTALELGELKEASDGTYYALDQHGKKMEVTAETFRSTLSSGWFSSEVLTKTLAVYGDFAEGLHEAVEDTGLTATELLGHIQDYKKAMENGEDMGVWVAELAKSENIKNVDALQKHLDYLSNDYNELGRSAFMASQECRKFSQVQDALKDAMSSGWMGIFTAIFGNYLESKELWSAVAEELYAILVDPLNDVKRIFQQWGDLGGREILIEALWNLWDNISGIIENIKEGFKEVFPDQGAVRSLLYFVQNLRDFSENMKMVDWPWYSEFQGIKDAARAIALAIFNLWTSVKRIGKAIKGAWEQIFPQNKGWSNPLVNAIKSIAEWIEKMSKKLVISEEQTAKLQRVFAGFFAVLDIVKEFIIAIAEAFGMLTEESEGFGDGLLDGAASIGDFLVSVRDWIKENDVWREGIKKVIDFIKDIPNKLDAVSRSLFNMGLAELWDKIKTAVGAAWTTIKDFFSKIPGYAEEASQKLFGMSLADLWDTIKQAALDAWEVIKDVFHKIIGLFTGSGEEAVEEGGEGIVEALPSGEDAEPVVTFADRINQSLQLMKKGWEEVKPYVDDFFKMIKENNDFEWPSLENLGEAGKTAGVIGILGGIAAMIWRFVKSLNKLDKDKSKIVNSIKYMFNSIGDAAKALKRNIQAQTFKTIATAILEIAAAIFILALLPTDKVVMSGIVIAGLFWELSYVFQAITSIKASEKKLAEIRKVIDALSVILAVIIAGIFVIATQTNINNAIAAAIMIAVLLAEVAGILQIFDQIRGNEAKSKQVIGMVLSMAVVIAAIGTALMMATMYGSWEQIAAAGAVMALMLAEIELFLLNLSKVKTSSINIPAMVAIAGGISSILLAMGKALATATAGGADWTQLAAAGVAMSIMMLSIAGAMKIMPEEKIMKKTASILVLSAKAFKYIGSALAEVTSSGADWLSMAVAGTVMAGMLEAIALAFRIMPDSNNVIKSAIAIVAVSAGLLLMANALSILGQMSLKEVGISLLALAGALVLVLAAGFAANYVGAGLIILGVAFALIGQGAMMAGAGLWLVADAMQKLFSLDPAGVGTLILAIQAFFGILPSLMEQVARGILAFLQVFVNAREAIKEIFVGTFTTIIDAYMEVMPRVVNAVVSTILNIIQAYRTLMPQFMAAFTETIVAIINALIEILPVFMEFLTELFYAVDAFVRETAPTFVDTVFFVLGLLWNALVAFIYKTAPELVNLVDFLVGILLQSLYNQTSMITSTLFNILIDTLNQILDNIGPIIALITQIAIRTVTGFIEGLTNEIPNIIDTGIEFIIGLINGISQGIEDHALEMRTAMENLAKSLMKAFLIMLGMDPEQAESVSTKFKDFGKNLIQGLIDGINGMVEAAGNAISAVANKLIDTFTKDTEEHSPSKLFKKFGKYIDEGLAIGLTDNVSLVEGATDEVADASINGMSNVISTISDMWNEDMDADPTIRPVLDLSNITEGASQIDDMFNSERTIGLASYNGELINGRITREEELARALGDIRNSMMGGNSTINKGMTQSNVFNITGDNPKQIANEISNILQNQVERRNAVWA